MQLGTKPSVPPKTGRESFPSSTRDVTGDISGKAQLENHVSTVIVNAKSALKARIENKTLLLEKSNLGKLEDTIKNLMAKTDVMNSIKTVVIRIDNVIGDILTSIEQSLKSQDTSGAGELRSSVNDRKSLFLSRSRSLIDSEIAQICQNVRSLIESQAEEAELNLSVESWMQQLISKIQTLQDTFVNEIQVLIDKGLDANSGFFTKRPDFEGLNQENLSGKKITDTLGEQAFNASKLLKAEHLKEAFKGLRSLKVPGFKFRWEKTLGKWAEKAMPYVQIAIAVWELWRGWKKDDEQRDKARQQVMQINRAIDELHYGLRKDIDLQLNTWVKQIEGELSKIIDTMVEETSTEIESLLGKQSRLHSIRQDLQKMLL